MRKAADTFKPEGSDLEGIGRAGLNAAWHALQHLNDESLSTPEKVLVCLRAFKVAEEEISKAESALKKGKPGVEYVSHPFDVTNVVCSAMAGIDMDSAADINPMSFAGERIAVFFKAAKAMEAMQAFDAALDNDDEIFGTWMADKTMDLAAEVLKAREELRALHKAKKQKGIT